VRTTKASRTGRFRPARPPPGCSPVHLPASSRWPDHGVIYVVASHGSSPSSCPARPGPSLHWRCGSLRRETGERLADLSHQQLLEGLRRRLSWGGLLAEADQRLPLRAVVNRSIVRPRAGSLAADSNGSRIDTAIVEHRRVQLRRDQRASSHPNSPVFRSYTPDPDQSGLGLFGLFQTITTGHTSLVRYFLVTSSYQHAPDRI
jgi:hypothetical protein